MSQQSVLVEEPREIHLLDYWRTAWRGRWTVLTIFVVVLTLVAIGTFTQKPIYRAMATVEINPQARKVSPVADVSDMGTGNFGWFSEERYYNTQYEVIKSRDVAKRVVEQLDLYSHPRFKDLTDPVGALTKMIQVEPVKETGIVQIILEGPNPEETASWVNAIADAYVQRNIDQAVQATKRAVQSLVQEITPLKEKLEGSQRTSFEFAARTNMFVPENQQKMTNERLSTLQSQLTDAQVKRSQVEGLLKQIDSVGRGDTGAYESIPEISNDPVVQGLYKEKVELEREYERLLVTYKGKHIRVQEKHSEIGNLNQKIAAEAGRIISNLKTQLALFRDQETKLSRAIEDTRADSLRDSEKASNFEMVRSEATETKRIYDLISARVKEIDLSSSLLNNNLRVLDSAPVPQAPVKPRKVLNLGVGMLLGLLLGVGAVFFLDYMDNTVRTSEDVEQFLRLNLLAIVPKEGENTERAAREAYQTLRTSLLFSRKNRAANAVLVTSAGPQEGKSQTVVNVARTLARSGERVMILDCDLRRPAIHDRLGLTRDRGLTNYILSSDGDDWRSYAKPTSEPGLHAITSGPLPPNPADVFGNERFGALLKELRGQFDWVFVDSPPIASLADVIILSSMVDMVAIVVRYNQSDREMIRRCVGNLRKVNANIIGAVLNSVDLDRSHYKDYHYVAYYYYGDSAPHKDKKRRDGSGPKLLSTSEDDEPISRSAG